MEKGERKEQGKIARRKQRKEEWKGWVRKKERGKERKEEGGRR